MVLLLQYSVYRWTKRNRLGSEQLLDVIEELKIAQSGKDDFVANVSHEIRTPINTICGMSETILREELPEQIKEHVVSMPSVLLGDEKKLRRIIKNLVDNAVKFTETGGVSLRIGYRKEEYGVNLVISVKDTGIGISESNLEKIFTSFNQVDASRKRQEGGLGLGLAISNALIRKMGGAITIKSKVGKGTVVQVVVPQKVLDETPIAMLQDRRAIKVATYIDMEQFDNRMNIRVMEDVLGNYNIKVTTAVSGKEALEKIKI